MKSYKQLLEDIQVGLAPKEISYKGYSTTNLHHAPDAAKAFQASIIRVQNGTLNDNGEVLAALKATDTYMKLNDMHLEQEQNLDSKELDQWLSAHKEAKSALTKIGEFEHHYDYWNSHNAELQYLKANQTMPQEAESVNVDEASKLQGTPVVSLSDFGSKDTTKNKYGQTVPKKLKQNDPRVKMYTEPKKEGVTEMDNRTASGDRREQRANSPEAIAQREKELQANLKKVSLKLRKKLRLPSPKKEGVAEGLAEAIASGNYSVELEDIGKPVLVNGKKGYVLLHIERHIGAGRLIAKVIRPKTGSKESHDLTSISRVQKGVSEGLADDFLSMAKNRNPNARIVTAVQKRKEAEELMKKREASGTKPSHAAPTSNPRPLGGYDPKSGRSYSESVEIEEAHKIGSRVEIIKGSAKGIKGHIGEIRSGAYQGAPKTYTVYHGDQGAVQVPKEHIRAVKEEVELDEALDFRKEAAKHMKDMHDKNATPTNKAYAQKMLQRALEASKMKDKAAAAKHYMGEEVELDEKTLTPAELKKREEVAKAMERKNPNMDKSRKMAIATAVAKRVAEQYDDAE
jgi:hypothetical protein